MLGSQVHIQKQISVFHFPHPQPQAFLPWPLSECSPPSYWNELGGGFSHMPPAETKRFYGNHPPGPYRSQLTVESPRNHATAMQMGSQVSQFGLRNAPCQKLSFSLGIPQPPQKVTPAPPSAPTSTFSFTCMLAGALPKDGN